MKVALYDLLGRQVAQLHDGPLAAGPPSFEVDAARLSAGVYFVVARGQREVRTQSLTIVR